MAWRNRERIHCRAAHYAADDLRRRKAGNTLRDVRSLGKSEGKPEDGTVPVLIARIANNKR